MIILLQLDVHKKLTTAKAKKIKISLGLPKNYFIQLSLKLIVHNATLDKHNNILLQ